jgi:hypothetical protein
VVQDFPQGPGFRSNLTVEAGAFKGKIHMDKEIKPDTWIWVIVQDPGVNEQYLGQLDEEKGELFIPAFQQKEDAQQCLIQMATDKGKKYEVQAICFDELAKDAEKNGFMIFILNEKGEISQKIKS